MHCITSASKQHILSCVHENGTSPCFKPTNDILDKMKDQLQKVLRRRFNYIYEDGIFLASTFLGKTCLILNLGSRYNDLFSFFYRLSI